MWRLSDQEFNIYIQRENKSSLKYVHLLFITLKQKSSHPSLENMMIPFNENMLKEEAVYLYILK